jgi:steroid 5-alpha reductase family enzyme
MLIALYMVLGFFTGFFIVAQIIKNNSIVDIGWGLGFVLVSWALFFLYGSDTVVAIITNILVSLWGLRLFYHILKRNLFEAEDFRYANWRKQWGKWVVPRAFLQVFMLQGILQFAIGSTAYYVNINEQSFATISIVGIVVWLIGYGFEVVGDRQLRNHIKNPNTSGLLTSGLWKHTRHPNYFGEALLWWGLYLFVILNGAPWYLIISPIVITTVLYFISTPLLEESMQKREGWDAYATKTSKFVPFLKR